MLNVKLAENTAGNEDVTKERQLAEEPTTSDLVKEGVLQANAFVSKKKWRLAEEKCNYVLSMDVSSVEAHELLFTAVVNSEQPERFMTVIESALINCATEPRFGCLDFVLAALSMEDAKSLHSKVSTKWPSGNLCRCLAGSQGLRPAGNTKLSDTSDAQESDAFAAQAFRLALRKGKDDSMEYLDTFLHSSNDVVANRAVQVKKIIDTLPNRSAFQRPLIRDDGTEFIKSQKTSSGTTVIYFDGLGYDREHSYELIDSYFSAAGYSSIFIRDRSLNLSMRGLRSLGKNRAETVSMLQSVLEEFETTRLLIVGRSAGGYSALQYGLLLEASKIVTFSGVSDVSEKFASSIEDDRAPMVRRRMNRENTYDDMCLDNLTDKTDSISEGIHMHFGSSVKFDRIHAENVEKKLGAKLHSIPDCDSHHTFHYYLENGSFFEQIAS